MGLFDPAACEWRRDTAYWMLGAAIAASAVSLATLPAAPAPTTHHVPTPIWVHHGCHQAKTPTDTAPDGPRVFVGPMIDSGAQRAILQETTRKTIASYRPAWRVEVTNAPATEVPGFYLEGTVEDLETSRVKTRPRSNISCEVTFWLASDHGQRFAIGTGTASVLTSRDHRDIALSRDACVQAVVEDLVEHRLIPAIERIY